MALLTMDKNRRCCRYAIAYINSAVGGGIPFAKDFSAMSAHRFFRRIRAAAFAAALLSPLPAAATPAIVDFDSIGFQNNLASAERTLGWYFTALADVTVTHLGVWDHGGDGLLAAHLTGLWDSSGTLLGSVSVQSGTASAASGPAIEGGVFRYEAIAPISLTAGAVYTIGALFDSNDIFEYFPIDVTTGAEIAYGEERFGDEGAGFLFPTDTFGRWGLFGPNFLYTAIAEPAAALLLALAIGVLAVAGIRPRRTATV